MKISYGDIKVKNKLLLKSGELFIPEKGLLAITGENGCGKTLLLRHLFFEMSVKGYNSVLIDQSSENIVKNKTILENIALSNTQENLKRAEQILSDFGFKHLLKHKAHELSGGEKRVINILRGFYSDADYIFIDEPTNELDYESVDKLQALIKNSKDKSIICITHDDRITKMSTQLYIIENFQLKLLNDKLDDKHLEEKNESYIIEKFDQKFLKSIFNRRWEVYLLILLMLATTMFSLYYLRKSLRDKIPEMNQNQVEIFIPIATLSTEIYEGAIPITYFGYISGSASYREMFAAFTSAYKDSEESGLNFGLNIPESNLYERYLIELYDVKINQKMLIPEIYMNNGAEASLSHDYFISNDYFILSKNIHQDLAGYVPKEVELNLNIYNQIIEEILFSYNENPNNLKILHLIIILDDNYDFSDFIASDSFKQISRGNYYLRSNESISIYNALESFKSIETVAIIIALASAFIILMELTFCILYFKVNKTKIKTLVNNGVPAKVLKNIIYKKYRVIWFRLLIVLVLILFCIITYKLNFDSIVQYFFIIYFIFFMIISEFFSKKIFKKKMKAHFHWRYR